MLLRGWGLLLASLLCLRSGGEDVGKFGKHRVYSARDYAVIWGVDAALVHWAALQGEGGVVVLLGLSLSLVASLLMHTTFAQVLRRLALLPFVWSSSPVGLAAWMAVLLYHVYWGFGSFPLLDCRDDASVKPLRVLFLSIGTRGDVQPFIQLGKEMQSRGHTVTLAALNPYRQLVLDAGLAFKSAGEEDLEQADYWLKCTHVSQVMAIPNFSKYFCDIGHQLYLAASETQPQVIVCTSTAQSMALTIADTMMPHHRPVVMCAKFAPDNPTRGNHAPGYFASPALLSWYHHWMLIALAANRVGMGKAEDLLRGQLGLPSLTAGKRLGELADCPTLLVCSPQLIARHGDWPASILVTGWWHGKLPNDTRPRHPRSSSTAKQVCITFGSMSQSAEAIGLISLLLQACRDEGWDVVLVGHKLDHHTSVQVIKEANYRELFPKVDCVIHHGGAGTTSSCLETNTPAIVIPILLWTDQPLWATRVHELKLGVHVPQRLALVPPHLVQQEQAAVSHNVRAALQTCHLSTFPALEHIATKLLQEDGVGNATRAIEYCANY